MAVAFPDWNDLRDILLITEAGTLSAAARAAGVSQSTMSRRLAAIEANGQPVFLRDESGKMTPNARGREMVAAAQAMRTLYDSLRQRMTDAPAPLRIGACDVSARLFMSCALPVWAGRSGTMAQLDLTEEPVDPAFDISVRVMNAVPERCIGQCIGRVEWGLYASAGYATANRIRGRLETFEGFAVIRASGGLGDSAAYRWLARQGGVVAMLASSTEAMVEACAGGMGIALLPVSWAEGDDRLLPVDGPHPAPSEVWATAEATRAEDPRISGFFRWARSHFRNSAPRSGDKKAG